MGRQRKKFTEKSGPETVSNVLTKSFDSLGIENMLREYSVKKLWTEAVGKAMARHARPEKLKKSTLYITAENTAWSNEFVYLKKTIIEKINALTKADTVRDIIIKTTGKKEDNAAAEDKPKKIFKKREVTAEELAEIHRLTSHVKDPAIRNAMRRAMTESKRNDTD